MIRLMLAVPALLLGTVLFEARADDENPIVALVKTKIKDPKQAFGMAVTFKIKAGSEKEFEAAFAPCVKATRQEPGCILYTFNRDVDEVGTYVVYEQFKNIAGLEAHAKTKHVEEFLKKAAPMFDGDPKAKVFAILAE